MKQLIISLLIVFFFPLTALAGSIEITDSYALATPPSQKNGAVFMKIVNNGEVDDSVVLARADVSERVELHTHEMDGGIMMMREVESYELPAGGEVILEPAGHHIMLIKLNQILIGNVPFPLTIEFEKHEPITVDVAVKALGGDE